MARLLTSFRKTGEFLDVSWFPCLEPHIVTGIIVASDIAVPNSKAVAELGASAVHNLVVTPPA